jgi:hypothetical protein
MTFGYSNFIPGDFDTIHLFENGFNKRGSNDELEGKTYSKKIIAISWYHFSASHLIHNDGENIGFYHIAQALVQSILNGKSSDDRFCAYFEPCAEQVLLELDKKITHPFYQEHLQFIKANDFESLFPYLMEWFFEIPTKMKAELPNSYAHLCVLMNQDPLAIENDYKFDSSKFQNKKGVNPIPSKILKTYKYYQNHWVKTLPLVSIIALPVFFNYYVRHRILLSNIEILIAWIMIGMVLFIAGNKFFIGRKLFKTQIGYFVSSFIGIGPIVLLIAFVISFLIPFNCETSEHLIVESHAIIGKSRRSTYIKYYQTYLENGFLEAYPEGREFYPGNQPRTAVVAGNYASFTIGTSIFGFKVIKEKFIFEKKHREADF